MKRFTTIYLTIILIQGVILITQNDTGEKHESVKIVRA